MFSPSLELRTAIEAARLSESRIMDFYNTMVQIPDAQASITTQADRDSQDIILGHLHKAFPSDGFLGEEKEWRILHYDSYGAELRGPTGRCTPTNQQKAHICRIGGRLLAARRCHPRHSLPGQCHPKPCSANPNPVKAEDAR
jgi:hypothetical protein